MLSLGVDAWNLPGDRRGIGRYVRAILRAWASDATDRVRVTLIVPEWATAVVRSRYERELDGRRYAIVSRRNAERRGLDAVWFPWNGMSWSTRLPTIATLHDATPFALPGAADRGGTFRVAAREATAILTDSAFSRDELARYLGIAPERFTVVALGATPALPRDAAADDRARAFGAYVLAVGANEPRKRIGVLAEAAALAGLRLVVAGAGHASEPYALRPHVTLLGHVSDPDLAALYRAAAVFAYASSYEGFGLPLLEAFVYDAPVVVSDLPVFRETAGTAALFVDGGDPHATAQAFTRAQDPRVRSALIAAGRVRAAELSWASCAEATLACCLATGRPGG